MSRDVRNKISLDGRDKMSEGCNFIDSLNRTQNSAFFMSLAIELFLHSRLKFRKNGPFECCLPPCLL